MSNYSYSFDACLQIGDEEDVEVTIHYDIEPAQHGGWSDPSWDAYASDYEVRRDGKVIETSEEDDKRIMKAIDEDMSNMDDYDGE